MAPGARLPPTRSGARQAAIVHLREPVGLARRPCAVLAEEARSLVSAEVLAAWGGGEPLLASKFLRFGTAMLAGLWLVRLAAWLVWGAGYPAFVISAGST